MCLIGIALAEIGASTYLDYFASPRVLTRYGSLRQVMAHDENRATIAKHTYLGYALLCFGEHRIHPRAVDASRAGAGGMARNLLGLPLPTHPRAG